MLEQFWVYFRIIWLEYTHGLMLYTRFGHHYFRNFRKCPKITFISEFFGHYRKFRKFWQGFRTLFLVRFSVCFAKLSDVRNPCFLSVQFRPSKVGQCRNTGKAERPKISAKCMALQQRHVPDFYDFIVSNVMSKKTKFVFSEFKRMSRKHFYIRKSQNKIFAIKSPNDYMKQNWKKVF